MNGATSVLQASKLWLIGHVGLAKDALHVYVALALFFGSALLFKWPLRSWRPFLVVLVAALAGEAWDLRDSAVYGTPIMLGGNLKDILNTSFWPLVILILARTTNLVRR